MKVFWFKNASPTCLISLIGLFLAGCSTSSETFDCKAGKGVGCKSISQVNKMVDEGVLGADPNTPSPLVPPVLAATAPSVDPSSVPVSDGLSVHRVQEEHLRVWLAPFQDVHGNFHEASVVHTVLKPGYWRLETSGPVPLNEGE